MSLKRELALLVTGKDVSATSTLKGVKKEVQSLDKIGSKAGRNLGKNLERGAIIAGAAAVGAGIAVTNAAMDFESSSASVAKTVEGNVDAIVASNRELAKTTGLEVNALNEISATAGALDVAKDDIDDFTKTVAMLGQTTDDVTTEVGAASLGHLRTTLGIDGEEWSRFGNTLVHLGNNGGSTEGQILSMAEGIAGAAGIMNATEAQVLGWSSALSNVGEEAEAGGSSIQRFWLESFKSVEKGGDELKLMAKISGQTVKAFKKDFGQDATGTLARFITKLGELSEAEQLATLEALGFTDIRITRALLKLTANTDNLTDSLSQSEKGWIENKAGTEEWQKRLDTTASKLSIFRANVHDAAITIGAELLPVLADLSEDAVAWIDAHQGDIKEFAQELGQGFRDAAQFAQQLDWDAIGAALGMAGQGAKAVASAFLGLPPWIQTAVLTGWGLNKLTGGAVIDLGKLAFDQFASRGSSPANPLWVQQVAGSAGGLGAVGGAGKGGGAMGALNKGLGLLSLVGAGLAAFETQQAVSQQSTDQAAQIKTGLDQSIAGKTLPQLREALAGVNQGITDIQSNPLFAFVQGEALTTLQTMRADLNAQIIKAEGHAATSLAAQRKGEQTMTVIGQKADSAAARHAERLEAAKRATADVGLRVDRGTERVSETIRNKDLSVTVNVPVSVTTRVTASGVSTAQTYRARYGGSGTSQDGKLVGPRDR